MSEREVRVGRHKNNAMDLNFSFSGPMKTAYSNLIDLELKAYFTYENMEFFYAPQVPPRNAFAEYFRRVKLAHRERAKKLMVMARENGWPFKIRLEGLPAKDFNWGYARFAFAAPKEIEREILDAILLLSRRANQLETRPIISLTDGFLEDQNRCLADVNLNLARLTRCNTLHNETIYNSYLAHLLTIENQAKKDQHATKDEIERNTTNESGYDEVDGDDDEWTDIDDDE